MIHVAHSWYWERARYLSRPLITVDPHWPVVYPWSPTRAVDATDRNGQEEHGFQPRRQAQDQQAPTTASRAAPRRARS